MSATTIDKYRSYLELANGNIETARRFFEKAYPGANHQEVYGLVDSPDGKVIKCLP